ncbi:MAG TPA: hypothetical protein VGL24_03065 [Chthoniobacterales bacterium]
MSVEFESLPLLIPMLAGDEEGLLEEVWPKAIGLAQISAAEVQALKISLVRFCICLSEVFWLEIPNLLENSPEPLQEFGFNKRSSLSQGAAVDNGPG